MSFTPDTLQISEDTEHNTLILTSTLHFKPLYIGTIISQFPNLENRKIGKFGNIWKIGNNFK